MRLFLASLCVGLLLLSNALPAGAAPPTPTPHPTASPAEAPSYTYTFPVVLTAEGKKLGKISYGKYHHDYPAADIFCPKGSHFVAPTSGTVEWVTTTDTWNPKRNDPATRGGLSVAMIGDDGVRYYGSHLSAVADGIEVGTHVDAGQMLGLTGKSGDARYVAPHLHFGISHPTTPEDWATRRGEIAPYPYLRAWQRGGQITPVLP